MKKSITLLKISSLIFIFFFCLNSGFAQSEDCGFVRNYSKNFEFLDGGKIVETANDYQFKIIANISSFGSEQKIFRGKLELADGAKKSFVTNNFPELSFGTGFEFSSTGDFYYTAKINTNGKIRLKKINISNQTTVWAKSISLANSPNTTSKINIRETQNHILINGNLIGGSSYLVKTNLQGQVVWKRESIDIFDSLAEDNNGNIYIKKFDGPISQKPAFVIKLDPNGNELWSTEVLRGLDNKLLSAGTSPDGNSLFISFRIGDARFPLIKKLNTDDGTILWEKDPADEFFQETHIGTIIDKVIPTQDGGVVFGYNTITLDNKFVIGKLSSNGAKVWVNTISNKFRLGGGTKTSDGGYIYFGTRNEKLSIVKFNSQGKIFPKCQSVNSGPCPNEFPGFSSLGEFNGNKYFLSNDVARPTDARSIAQSNNGYLATINSQAENDFLQSKISGLVYVGANDENNEGQVKWESGENPSFSNFDNCSICQPNSPELDFVVMQSWNGKWSWSNFFNQRQYIMEIPCDASVPNTLIFSPEAVAEDSNKPLLESIMPNPATDMINIKMVSSNETDVEVHIMDARGQIIKSTNTRLRKGISFVQFDISDLPGGFYFVFVPNAQRGNSQVKFVKTSL